MRQAIVPHDCISELHAAKLRATPARLGVLAILEHTDVPVDVSMIMEYLKNHHIAADEVTVFRILNVLTGKGIVKPIQFLEGKFRYEHAGEPKHHHFVCQKCGLVMNVTDCNVSRIEKKLEKTKGITVTSHSLEFFGVCYRCQTQ